MLDSVMSRTWGKGYWLALLAALVVVPNLFAFHQLRATGGYLFYSNAFDESMYLSYDGAMMTRSVTRLAEYVVVALHGLGVSGGYINLLFDLVVPVLTVEVLRRIALRIGCSALESAVYPLLVVALPILFGYSNPYYGTLFDRHYAAASLKWITLPQAYYPPFFRTPEPQVSLLVLAFATSVALRWRSYVPAFLAAAIVYPLVGVPYAFVTVCVFVADKTRPIIHSDALRAAVAALTGYLAIATAVFLYYTWFVRGTMFADALALTRLPLVSGTGIAAAIVFACARKRLPPELYHPALFLALAPTAVANTQLASGFIASPHSFEQNFGVVALGLVVALAIHAMPQRTWVLRAAGPVAVILLGVYSSHIFAVNSSVLQGLRPSQTLLDALRADPASVVMGDPDLADVYSLIAPRLHFSALARAQTYQAGAALTAERFGRYLCTKSIVAHSSDPGAVPAEAFQLLDRSFRYLNQDFPLNNLRRAALPKQVFDPSQPPVNCRSRRLYVFPALDTGPEIGEGSLLDSLRQASKAAARDGAVGVVTPTQQWAYASVVPLPAIPQFDRGAAQLAELKLMATVTGGCVGAGILSPDQRVFDAQTLILPSSGAQIIDIVFQPRAPHNWFVVMNCSADGQSTATIEAIHFLTVNDVSVRPLDERVVEMEP